MSRLTPDLFNARSKSTFGRIKVTGAPDIRVYFFPFLLSLSCHEYGWRRCMYIGSSLPFRSLFVFVVFSYSCRFKGPTDFTYVLGIKNWTSKSQSLTVFVIFIKHPRHNILKAIKEIKAVHCSLLFFDLVPSLKPKWLYWNKWMNKANWASL